MPEIGSYLTAARNNPESIQLRPGEGEGVLTPTGTAVSFKDKACIKFSSASLPSSDSRALNRQTLHDFQASLISTFGGDIGGRAFGVGLADKMASGKFLTATDVNDAYQRGQTEELSTRLLPSNAGPQTASVRERDARRTTQLERTITDNIGREISRRAPELAETPLETRRALAQVVIGRLRDENRPASDFMTVMREVANDHADRMRGELEAPQIEGVVGPVIPPQPEGVVPVPEGQVEGGAR